MVESYQIREGLGVFWRSSQTLQIGLDSRTGVTIEGLKKNEQDFVAQLCRPIAEAELDFVARGHRLRPARAAQILRMLQRAGVLRPTGDDGPPGLAKACVAIDRLDPLGVSIGLGLARCGVGAIVFDDTARVGADDHPALFSRQRGQTRGRAFLSALRAVSPGVEHIGDPSLTVVTGSRLIAPSRTHDLWDAGRAHLLAWVEEVDTCVGPLVEPGRGACAECIQTARREADDAWDQLAPQAALAPAIAPKPDARDLASALAVRAILGFLAGSGNTLGDAQWRITSGARAPQLIEVAARPACGCTQAVPRLRAVEPAASTQPAQSSVAAADRRGQRRQEERRSQEDSHR
ncbi:MAG: hypothetical protein Q3979_03710 [Actinomycetaceae bacterium]|nr:hypothetical protein [Actinomycetaceae bacterium]